MRDSLSSKMKGDAAFRHKDFKTAIASYTLVRKFMALKLVILNNIKIIKSLYALFLLGERNNKI